MTRFLQALAAAAAFSALAGCTLGKSAPTEAEVRQITTRVADGNEVVCRVERPLGSRVKQRICMTAQEASLRDLQAETLYRNSLVALHGGRP